LEQKRARRLDAAARMAEMTRRAKRSRQQAWARGDMKVGTAILRPGDPAFDLGANVTDVLAATGVDVLAD
jgi:hypothetical protein